MAQETFLPTNYAFNWTQPRDKSNPLDLGWYEWDRKEGHKLARKARDERYKQLRQEGKTPFKYSSKDSLITKGGIGSAHPQVEFIVTVYGVSYS